MPEDNFGTAGAEAGDLQGGALEGSSDEPLSLEDIAAEVDAEIVGESASEGESRSKDGEGEGKGNRAPVLDTPEKVKQFVDKNYDGDYEAFLAAQYHSREENKRLSERVRELEASVPKPTPAQAQEALVEHFNALRARDPEVQALDHEIQTVDSDLKQLVADQNTLINRANKVNATHAEVVGKLAAVDPEDGRARQALEYRKLELESELRSIDVEFVSNEKLKKSYAANKRSFERSLKDVERRIEESIRNNERQAREADSANRHTVRVFDGSFRSIAPAFLIDPASERGQFFRNTVQSQLADYLESEVGEAEGLDAQGLYEKTAEIASMVAKHMGIARRRPGSSTTSSATPRPVAHRPPPRVPASRDGYHAPSSDDILTDPNKVRERAQRIMERQLRRPARG